MRGRRTAAVGLAVVLCALVPACASDDDGTTTTAPDATEQPSDDDGTITAPDATEQPSDGAIDPTRELRIATTSPPPTTWDPAAFNGSVTQLPKFYNAVYDTLLRLDHNDELQPLLATSWEYDSTNTVLTLTLRDDVTFTDGAPFDAAAAKLNLDRVRTGPSSPGQLLAGIASIEAPSPTELVITQKAPTAKIISAMASVAASMVSPLAIESGPDALAQNPVGTGPYVLGELTLTSATFERNENYWDTETVFPARQTIMGMTDPNARINAILTDAVDFADLSQEPPTPDVLAKVDAGELAMLTINTTPTMIGMNSLIPPLDNEKVRLAINHAIDRETYNEIEFDGLCATTSQLFLPGQPGYIEGLEYEFDVEKAKQLMEESGVGEITIPYQSIAGTSQAGTELYAAMLSEIGITLEIVTSPVQEVFPNYFAGQYATSALRLFVSMPDVSYIPDFLTGPLHPGEKPQELVDMVDAAVALAPDDPDRTAAFEEINQYAFDHAIVAPVCNSPKTWVYDPDVVGVEEITMGPIGSVDTTRMGMRAES